jgi:hypothetical protein
MQQMQGHVFLNDLQCSFSVDFSSTQLLQSLRLIYVQGPVIMVLSTDATINLALATTET